MNKLRFLDLDEDRACDLMRSLQLIYYYSGQITYRCENLPNNKFNIFVEGEEKMISTRDSIKVKDGDRLELSTEYNEDDLICYYTDGATRTEYSKITKIYVETKAQELGDRSVVGVVATECNAYVPVVNIISVEKKAEG